MKIISGGQTGVDRAALDVALDLDIECGGFCPKGRKSEDGVIPERYPLTETKTDEYSERTEYNVQASDGTLVLIDEDADKGTSLTITLCKRYNKAFIIADVSENNHFAKIIQWIKGNNIEVLNIAGSRESFSPGIYRNSYEFLHKILVNIQKFTTMSNIPIVETQMLIRKPVEEVFNAFIDPAITTKFWFTKSSGKLEVGKAVTWEWEMYGVFTKVLTKQIVPNKMISTEWGDHSTTIDYEFTALTETTTYVVIKNYGFRQTGNELIQAIKDNTGGFTTVLDGLKAYLEHEIQLNLVRDKFPKEVSIIGK